MENNVQTPMDAFFPDGRIYEHFLQRLRLLASQQTPVLKMHDIRDVPDARTDLPCIEVEVVVRIPGFKIHNPVTGKPMLSTDWIKNHFEGRSSQTAFLNAFAEYLASSIPAGHPEAHLKPKFKHYRDGLPGNLPTRADLYVEHQELARQLRAAQKWLRGRKRFYQGFRKEDKAEFFEAASHPAFWWAIYIKRGDIMLEQIANQSPQSNAKQILGLKYKRGYEAIKSRLSRKEV